MRPFNICIALGIAALIAGCVQMPRPKPAPTYDELPLVEFKVKGKECDVDEKVDSDCDGVPDYRDQCPGEPKCEKADDRGCPIDSDGDGVPDYLDKCPQIPQEAGVVRDGCPPDTDGDGITDDRDNCPATPRGVRVDGNGCPLDTDGDGVTNDMDKCPGTPKGAIVDSRGCWVIRDTLFDFNKYVIKAQYYHALDRVVALLNMNPYLNIEIQGHTCNLGSTQYNQILSGNRARAVMDYFVARGVNRSRLSAVGYGLTRPKASSATPQGRALNRRVELHSILSVR